MKMLKYKYLKIQLQVWYLSKCTWLHSITDISQHSNSQSEVEKQHTTRENSHTAEMTLMTIIQQLTILILAS